MDKESQSILARDVPIRGPGWRLNSWRRGHLYSEVLGPWIKRNCWLCAFGWGGLGSILVAWFG